jgi:ABC-type polysaccharide/polyol phosphate transport system ATPase subunit
MNIIEFRNVSKTFSRNSKPLLLRDHLRHWRGRAVQERFYALKRVSFTVERGVSLAILGANGAGKSTLLSVVAGLAPPDEGSVVVRGRVSASLELGSGFHPDLTGAENVRLNAALLGATRKETNRLFDRIVEFSGIGDFIDELQRTYSTGMIMRLAFAVAVNMNPDILLIDEALAVGDQAFQTKCFEKIRELLREGKTLLCVSHSPALVREICARAIWLDRGELMLEGRLADVEDAYEGRQAANA